MLIKNYLTTCWDSFYSYADIPFSKISLYVNSLNQEPNIKKNIWPDFYNKTSSAWAEFKENPTLPSFGNFLIKASFIEDTAEDASYSSIAFISLIAEKSLKTVADLFFNLCPPLLTMISPPPSLLDYTALKTIAALATCNTLLSSSTTNKQLEKRLDSITMGATIGTILSALFNHNLYIGAVSGALSGYAVGTLEITKAQNFLLNTCPASTVQNIFLSFSWDLILSATAFIGAASSISQKHQTLDWPSVFSISLIPSLLTYSFFYSNTPSLKKVSSKAVQYTLPIFLTGYASMNLSLLFQHSLAYLYSARA